jgi:N6-L-threonylcarbamoyladenine synthase
MGRESLDFSFSGLKTAVLYHVRGVPGKPPRTSPPDATELADIAAGFQAACIAVLSEKLRRAVRQTRARSILVGGGVSANAGLRAALKAFPVPVFFPPLSYCTDNAAMSAGLAAVAHDRGEFASLDLDAVTYSKFAR